MKDMILNVVFLVSIAVLGVSAVLASSVMYQNAETLKTIMEISFIIYTLAGFIIVAER